MSRKIIGSLLVSVGLVLIVCAGGMAFFNERQDSLAGQNAEILLNQLNQEIEHSVEQSIYETARPEKLPMGEMLQTTLQGYDLVGSIRFPTLGVELPVLNTWDYDLLQIAPGRYSGSIEDRNLILLGHNYKRHFGPLHRLAVGDVVEFIGVDGVRYLYQVAATEVLDGTELERLTSSDYALTIFTCTNGGYSRFVVRCNLGSDLKKLDNILK